MAKKTSGKVKSTKKTGEVKEPTPRKSERAKKKVSGLDAAALVLAEAAEPMRCGDVAAKVIERGLWSTKGKTPAATLNAAIIREIRDKGKESRFRKAGRGLFAAAGKGG